jgi:hypothetical protein
MHDGPLEEEREIVGGAGFHVELTRTEAVDFAKVRPDKEPDSPNYLRPRVRFLPRAGRYVLSLQLSSHEHRLVATQVYIQSLETQTEKYTEKVRSATFIPITIWMDDILAVHE